MNAIRPQRRLRVCTSPGAVPSGLELWCKLRVDPIKVSNRLRLGLGFTFVLFLIASHCPVLAQNIVGSVTRLQGSASGVIDGTRSDLEVGSEIHMGDSVETDDESIVELTMSDGTKATLGENTELTVDTYIYTPDVTGQGIIFVTRGLFLVDAGSIASFGDSALQIRMPGANVAVTKTEFWGQQTSEKLTVVLLKNKSIIVSNLAGSVVLSRRNTATIVTPLTASPSQPFPVSSGDVQQILGSVSWP